ncbi:MAG: alpha/beta hydrolase, partial [Clostridia bacterium]|nr:alpha/beta hydrolase [Clostridia bacterium]
MKRYAINKEFGIFRYLKIPVMPPKMAGFVGGLLRAPGWVFRSIEVEVSRQKIKGYQQGEIEVLCFSPRGVAPKAPCLVYYHGGGFFFGAAGYHYKLCMQYAAELGCKIVFVQYRLAPKSPFPIPVEDCYAAYKWTVSHADMLGIDVNRIAVGGDSAGGCLAAAVSLMLRDRGDVLPLFQLLIYPVTDRRMQTESNKKYTDTPMWHSRLSVKMWQSYL